MSKNINLVCDDKALLVGAAELASDLGLRPSAKTARAMSLHTAASMNFSAVFR